jgi:uncharacterized protein (DUF433 family)
MSVPVVVNLITNGLSTTEIIADYPYLELEDIGQALKYAAWLTCDFIVMLKTGNLEQYLK